jgi:glycerol-3-phosphate dehydrogenase (NAD(P)+)
VVNISLLGCGTWGSALAQVVAENGHRVTAWHYKKDVLDIRALSRKHPRLKGLIFHDNIHFEHDLAASLTKAQCIIVAVPSHTVRKIMAQSKPFIPKKAVIVNVAKGIENDTLKTMSEVIAISLNHDMNKIVSLYGPSHAEEVVANYPTTLVSASSSEKSASYVQKIFSSDTLRVYRNHDIRGVELGGSLKNVIAIAAGICDGIGFGDNTKAALLTRGIYEITQLGIAMGAIAETFSGLSGVGDLIVTCYSRHSRNRFVGEEIGKGKPLDLILDKMEMVAEGVKTTKSVRDLSIKYHVEMPISEGVFQILFNKKDPKETVTSLMTRDLIHERKKP